MNGTNIDVKGRREEHKVMIKLIVTRTCTVSDRIFGPFVQSTSYTFICRDPKQHSLLILNIVTPVDPLILAIFNKSLKCILFNTLWFNTLSYLTLLPPLKCVIHHHFSSSPSTVRLEVSLSLIVYAHLFLRPAVPTTTSGFANDPGASGLKSLVVC